MIEVEIRDNLKIVLDGNAVVETVYRVRNYDGTYELVSSKVRGQDISRVTLRDGLSEEEVDKFFSEQKSLNTAVIKDNRINDDRRYRKWER